MRFRRIEAVPKKLFPRPRKTRFSKAHFFVVPQRGGRYRPILNLKPLNVFLQNKYFNIESLKSIIQALNIGDWVEMPICANIFSWKKHLRFCIDKQPTIIRLFGLISISVHEIYEYNTCRNASKKSTCFHLQVFMYADGLWSNFYHGYIFFHHSTYFSQSLCFGLMEASIDLLPLCQTQDVSNSILSSVPAVAKRWVS